MITILGGGIAGVTLARALAVRGKRDVHILPRSSPPILQFFPNYPLPHWLSQYH